MTNLLHILSLNTLNIPYIGSKIRGIWGGKLKMSDNIIKDSIILAKEERSPSESLNSDPKIPTDILKSTETTINTNNKVAQDPLQLPPIATDTTKEDAKPEAKEDPDERFRSTSEAQNLQAEIDKMAQELAGNSQANEQFTEELITITELLETSAPELTKGGLNRGPKLSQRITMGKKASLQASQKMEKEMLVNHAKNKGLEALKETNRALDLNRSFGDMVRRPQNVAEYTAVKVAQTHLSPTQFRDMVTNKSKTMGDALNMAQANMINRVNKLQQIQQQSNKQHNNTVAHQPHGNFLTQKMGFLDSLHNGIRDMLDRKPNLLSAAKGALGLMRAQSTPSAARPVHEPSAGLQLKK